MNNLFRIAARLMILAGFIFSFWGDWSAPVIIAAAAFFSIAATDDKSYLVDKIVTASLMAFAVFYGFPHTPISPEEVRAILQSGSAAYLATYFLGGIISDYFNQRGAFDH